MQVQETTREGLRRELRITVPRDEMADQLAGKLNELKDRVQLKGFRRGKVPMTHLRKVYGKQAMADIVNDTIQRRTGEVLAERAEKAAQRPEIVMTEDETEANAILSGEADFTYTVAYEVLPEFELPDVEAIEIERPVADISDDEVEENVNRLAENTRGYETRDGAAEKGDRVTMDYVGRIDGEPFDGGTDTDAKLVLGSGRFIPGFEDGLIGATVGEEKIVPVTFPEDYGAAQLAGKSAEFTVTVKAIEAPRELTIDDETARQLGVESAEKLREAVRSQLESRNGSFTRAKVKRQVLDRLDEAFDFALPEKMVEQEFDNIWNQVTGELKRAGRSFEDEETTEEDARGEYRRLAERRVRLGLVLARIGEAANIQISEEELQRAIFDQVRQYPGREQEVFEFFRKNPDAVAGLRAPLYEDKVVDLIVSRAKVSDRTVSLDELRQQDEEMPARIMRPASGNEGADGAEGADKDPEAS